MYIFLLREIYIYTSGSWFIPNFVFIEPSPFVFDFFPNARGFDSDYVVIMAGPFSQVKQASHFVVIGHVAIAEQRAGKISSHRLKTLLMLKHLLSSDYFSFWNFSPVDARARPASWRFLRNKMPRPSLSDKLNTAKSFQQRLLNYNIILAAEKVSQFLLWGKKMSAFLHVPIENRRRSDCCIIM